MSMLHIVLDLRQAGLAQILGQFTLDQIHHVRIQLVAHQAQKRRCGNQLQLGIFVLAAGSLQVFGNADGKKLGLMLLRLH